MAAAPPLLLPLLLLLLLAALTTPGDRHAVEASFAEESAALRSRILSWHDRTLPPPPIPPTNLHIVWRILNVDLNEYQQYLMVESIMGVVWWDYRLDWYYRYNVGNNIRFINVFSDEIWVPHIGVIHKWDDDPEESSLATIRCVAYIDGDAICNRPARFRSRCEQDYSRWPYTIHNCTMRLGINVPYNKFTHINWKIYDEGSSHNWDDMQTFSHLEVVAGKYVLVVSFLLKRYSLIQTVAFITPAFVLALLTVSSWLLPSGCDERLLLATLSVFLHCVAIDSLADAMPESGASAPQVALMYRDLLMVASASFMAAVVLRGLSGLDTPAWLPPLLESAPARFLLCTRRQQGDDTEGLVGGEDGAAAATPPPTPASRLALLADRLGLLASTAACAAAISLSLADAR